MLIGRQGRLSGVYEPAVPYRVLLGKEAGKATKKKKKKRQRINTLDRYLKEEAFNVTAQGDH